MAPHDDGIAAEALGVPRDVATGYFRITALQRLAAGGISLSRGSGLVSRTR
jgi:hypothetical protein